MSKKCLVDADFWKGKKIFLTGHTGFKGGWLAYWLHLMGAHVYGYALPPSTTPSIFNVLELDKLIDASFLSDIRDLQELQKVIIDAAPDIVFHMAAQPLVQYSYMNPLETYEVNVMGTAYVLEAMRSVPSIKATLIITTDKCYENQGFARGYHENDIIGGHDPYSSSKGCAELLISAYRRSFFDSTGSPNAIASARAGNVIGGGDWSIDRLIPDAVRSFGSNVSLPIRNPQAVRPWQHVLEPLSGYLILAQALYNHGKDFASGWNFGPAEIDSRPVHEVMKLLIDRWGASAHWHQDLEFRPHEAKILTLDSGKARNGLGWSPKWGLEIALERTVDWYKAFLIKNDMRLFTKKQIESYQHGDQA